MTSPHESTARPARSRLDGRVLVGNLVGAGPLLALLAALSWPLAVVGAAYVAAASVFLAEVYGRPALTRGQEAVAWVTPWLAASALWAGVLAGIQGDTSPWLLHVWFGVIVATPSYLGWQALALAVRQLLAWRGTSSSS